jgi:putative NADH-flavin reductase
MRILVFGSTGKLGQLVVKEALRRGHLVTGFVRRPEQLAVTHPNVRIVFGDIYDPASIDQAMGGHEAVISALGMSFFGRAPICSDGMRAIVPAMERHGVRRLLAVSAFGAGEDQNYNLYTRFLRFVVPHQMVDKDAMEDLVRPTHLDWTIIRPAPYLDFFQSGKFAVRDKLRGLFSFSTRQGVAQATISLLEQNKAVHQAVAIESGK